jgi:hypothetical protein
VKGLIADNNAIGLISDLVRAMQAESWATLWSGLGVSLKQFEDVGLTATSTDTEIWHKCQAEELVLITDNRNEDSPDSLEATIRPHNQPHCLPVITIGNLNKFRNDRQYAERVVEKLYDYLFRIDELRGTGRLYLP